MHRSDGPRAYPGPLLEKRGNALARGEATKSGGATGNEPGLWLEGYGFQILLSMKAASWVLDRAPTFWASSAPFLKSIRVGMPRTLYLGGVTGFSSMLSFATLRRPSYSEAMWSSAGAIILHGPHHSAQ